MGHLDDYWNGVDASLQAEFEVTRQTIADTDVKGGRNEALMRNFLSEQVAQRVVGGVALIDAYGEQSAEQDVVICNADQPFAHADASRVIVEGVDAVVQVKAVCTTGELERLVDNARTVKKLRRKQGSRDQVWAVLSDVPHLVERVAYAGYCFDSQITLDRARQAIADACAEVPVEEQPEFVAIARRGLLLNVRANDGRIRLDGDYEGWVAATTGNDAELTHFMWWLYLAMVRFRRWQHPLVHYAPYGPPVE